MGKGKQGQVQHVGNKELPMVTQCPAPGQAFLSASPACGDTAHPRLECPCTPAQWLQHCPTASGNIHDGFHPSLKGNTSALGASQAATLVWGLGQLIPLLSSSSSYCFRLTAAAASTLELSSTCCLTLLKPQVLLSQLQRTDN